MVERINFVIITVKTYDTIQQDLLTQPELLSLKQNKNIYKIRKIIFFGRLTIKIFSDGHLFTILLTGQISPE